jgi:hypothetical protein
MKTDLFKSLKAVAFLALPLFFMVKAEATHLLYGTLYWRSAPAASPSLVDITFNLQMGFRLDWEHYVIAPTKVGDLFYLNEPSLQILDKNGNQIGELVPWFRVIAIDTANDWVIGEALDPSVYSALTDKGTGVNSAANDAFRAGLPGGISFRLSTAQAPFTALIQDCCRSLTLNNGANQNFRLATVVDPTKSDHSPVSTLPAVLNLPIDPAISFTLPAIVFHGNSAYFRFATSEESGNFDDEPVPPGLQINPSTGRVTWDTSHPFFGPAGPVPYTGLWTVQFIIEERDINYNLKSSTPLDVLLNVNGHVPVVLVNNSKTPAPILVQAGSTASFTVVASDIDLGDSITLSAANLPVGSSMTRSLPATEAALSPISPPSSITSTFNWTPAVADAGSHILGFSATDKIGFQSLVPVTVVVNVPPVARCLDISLTADQNCQATLFASQINNGSSDANGDSLTLLVSDAVATTPSPSLVLSGVGDHTVTLTVQDGHGGSSTCHATVTLLDQRPPSIVCPAAVPALVLDADCSVTLPDYRTLANASDTCSSVTVTQDPAPGSIFEGVGSLLVKLIAQDSSQNTKDCSFTVVVVDSTPPILGACPGNQTVTAPTIAGAVASFTTPTAAENCGSVNVSCVPASGGTFPLGITTVVCTAADDAGNSAQCSFNVSVAYSWSGLLQPINTDGSSVFKLGSTVPVKFQLTGASAGIANATAKFSYTKIGSGAGTVNETVSTASADSGNTFRYDATSSQYIFNWSTKGLTSGNYQLKVDLGDSVSRTVNVGLK